MITAGDHRALARFPSAAARRDDPAERGSGESRPATAACCARSPAAPKCRPSSKRRRRAPRRRKIREINSGFYVFDVQDLYSNIGEAFHRNAHARILPDRHGRGAAQGNAQRVVASKTANAERSAGRQYARRTGRHRRKDAPGQMPPADGRRRDGVLSRNLRDRCRRRDRARHRHRALRATAGQRRKIGTACRVRSYSVIRDSEIGDGVTDPPRLRDGRSAQVAAGAVMGPYSHLRPGSEIGEGAHVGQFCRDQENQAGQRIEGEPPDLPWATRRSARA